MVTAAIDVHKRVLQAVVLDSESGECAEERLAGREALVDWAMRWRGRVTAVAIEATTGWRWVARELQAAGFDVRLVDPGQAKALQGRKRRAKTDRLDARWLALLLAKQMLPEAWLPPAEIQYLRDRTRLRKALVDDRTRWAQRLHALLTEEGWPCKRERLLTRAGRRWASALALPELARVQVELYLRLLETLDVEIATLEGELRRFARADRRCQGLERSSVSARSSPATCSRRSATLAASAAPARSPGWPASTQSSNNPPTAAAAASSPSRARPRCAGRWSKPPSTPRAGRAPTGCCTPPPAAGSALSARS
jgi:transposase